MSMRITRGNSRLRAILVYAMCASGSGLFLPSELRAQGEAEREAVRLFVDSVNALPTIKATDSIPKKWHDKQPGGMNEIRRGLLEWHKGHLSGEQIHYEKAVAQFERATRKAGDWPYPWYFLGLTKLEMLTHAFRVRGVTQQSGAPYRRYYSEGIRALERSEEANPSFPPTRSFISEYGAWLTFMEAENTSATLKEADPDGVRAVLALAPPRFTS